MPLEAEEVRFSYRAPFGMLTVSGPGVKLAI